MVRRCAGTGRNTSHYMHRQFTLYAQALSHNACMGTATLYAQALSHYMHGHRHYEHGHCHAICTGTVTSYARALTHYALAPLRYMHGHFHTMHGHCHTDTHTGHLGHRCVHTGTHTHTHTHNTHSWVDCHSTSWNTQLSVIHLSSCFPWCAVGMISM